jgi:5-methylcytosine-specific restriction endonuclease McrA
MPKKKVVRKSKVEKTRNHGTMTESGFWGFIRSTLRSKSRWWKPILECKKAAKRKSQSSNKRLKWEYQCNICKNWFPEKEISIDHISSIGSLKSAQDLPKFVETLYCEINNLQTACKLCHDAKTKLDNAKLKENE